MPSTLLSQIPIELPSISVFFLSSLLMATAATYMQARAVIANRWRLLRPALVLAMFLTIFFQWPSAAIAGAIVSGLQTTWLFWVSIHLTPLALVGWVLMTPWLDRASSTTSTPKYGYLAVLAPALLMVVCAAIYLHRVPFNCTALYAFIYDPPLTLLAREISIKFAGSVVATYSYGAMANTLAPALIGLSIPLALSALGVRRLHILAFCAVAILVSIFLVLLAGSKGLLVPSALFIIGSALAWHPGTPAKIIYPMIALAILFLGLVSFEVLKERTALENGRYSFASCVVRMNLCTAIRPLMVSMRGRDGSLGLKAAQVEALERDRQAACTAGEPRGEATLAAPHNPRLRDPRAIDWRSRSYAYAVALAYRALVTPIQVASWYFLYSQQEGRPGMAAMPIGTRFADHKINMAVEVYRKYGVVFSGGDATSTSTAPTSSVFAYPASLGAIGVPLVLLLVFLFDAIYMAAARRVSNNLLGVVAGLTLVIATNLILSDFVTVMESHGGAAAVALLAFYAGARKWVAVNTRGRDIA